MCVHAHVVVSHACSYVFTHGVHVCIAINVATENVLVTVIILLQVRGESQGWELITKISYDIVI